MKYQKLYKKFEKESLEWLQALDRYNDEPFISKPSEKEWSLGQLYDHLANGTIEFHLKNIQNCIAKKEGQNKGGKKFAGKMLYSMGMLPKRKVKSPKHEKNPPAQPENVKAAHNDMIKVMKAMRTAAIEMENVDLKYKTKHGMFGNLNAVEWYKLVIWHFKHHRRQKKKLDRRLVKRR